MSDAFAPLNSDDKAPANGTQDVRLHVAGMGDNVIDFNVTLERSFVGGNSVNFSILSKQMGFESAYLGVIGRDTEGTLIINVLTNAGVDTRFLLEREGETGKCRIELIDGDRVITDINDLGVVRTDPFIITDEVLAYLNGFDLVHTACYGCMMPELHKLNEVGIPVLYDYSDKWTEAKLINVAPIADFILFSGKDLEDDHLIALLRSIVGHGRCRMALTTIGERGAIVFDGVDVFRTPSFAEGQDIIDSTAAGDSFITGFIMSYLYGHKLFRRFERNSAIQQEWKISPLCARAYEKSLIRHAIGVGNVMALYTCMHEGSFGSGSSVIAKRSKRKEGER